MKKSEMKTLLYTISFVALLVGIHGRAVDEMDNSLADDQSSDDTKSFTFADVLRISSAPPARIIQKTGIPIELECEVTGVPTPRIHWITGHRTNFNVDELESNSVSDSPTALVRVRSRLVVEPVHGERTYTCVGVAAGKQVYATTKIIGSTRTSAEPKARKLSVRKARIVYYYSGIFEFMGSDMVLPCSVVAWPRADVYWLDNNENEIRGDNPRFEVLSNGSLKVRQLTWEDMGSYTCVANNRLAKDRVTTFVYPLSPAPRE